MWKPITGNIYTHKECGDRTQNDALFDNFVKDFQLDSYNWDPHVKNMMRFLEGGRNYNTGAGEYDRCPYVDHAAAFKSNSILEDGKKIVVYAFHPYGWSDKQTKELEDWCNARDLIYVICPPSRSFYNSEATYMILLLSQNTYIRCLEEIRHFPQDYTI